MTTDSKRKLLALVVLAGGIFAAVTWRDQLSVDDLIAWVESFGWLAPAVFIFLYSITPVFLLPGLVMTLAGGVLFGPFYGTLYNLIGATAGATLAFLVSRYIASDWVRERSGPRLSKLVQGVEDEGWRFVAFIRLVPIFPYNLLNYALGLTRIPLIHYIITTFIFMAPSGAAYTYLGYAGREAAAGGEDAIKKILLAIAIIATVVFVTHVIKRRRRARVNTE